ncbi:EAL domain-containing protein [uncultured Clostridium sp.]|uniref:bifunctional diguanylate cyclase/phosphodiesterase n=1 Tax=uncultured Clostridium sp. TaxID=59620 RepID=UPI00272B5ACC|nr:EAL domain-containing protein [uncultured Clostridium sp.]
MKDRFQINRKLVAIAIIFMLIFIIASTGLINIILDNDVKLTSDVHFKQSTIQLEKDISLLRSTTEKISKNDKIIEIFTNNPSFDQLDNEEKSIIMEQINLYEQNLESSSFVDTVNIINIHGNYLFSKGTTYDNFKLDDRPWFKQEYFKLNKDSFITEIHKDFITGKLIIYYLTKTEFYFYLIKIPLNDSFIRPILITTKIIVILVGVIISISLIISVKFAFKPALQSIDKLKKLMNKLSTPDDKIALDNMDEFTQLEVISSGLGKSFDDKIQSLIYHDSLTGLPNRKKLNLICKELIEKNKEFALIFIDLNKFKKVNDIFGHSVGDKLLITFSTILRETLKEKGELIRYSGDEFIIVYKEFLEDKNFIEYYKNEIISKFINPIEIQKDIKINIEFSSGIAVYPRDGDNIDDLIDKSDFMMYTSKNTNAPYELLFFNDNIYKNMIYIETLKNELKYSIEKNEIIIKYQPIFDVNKSIVKAEALIRWNSKTLGMIRPDNFINYAEETREIIPIGYWIIENVCDFINKNKIQISIGINISPIQLLEADFVEKTIDILNKYNIDTNKVYFEITESVLLEDNKIVKDNILNLRKIGIAIALDDFGTGYASFSYLKKYKLDILKIDKLFIDNESDNEFAIVGYIKRISNLLNMKVIIEGVETEKQFNELKNIGCNFFQGYYLSKVIDKEDLLKLL